MKQTVQPGAAPLKPGAATVPTAPPWGKDADPLAAPGPHAARALLPGTISESALGADVMYAVRGFRAGLMDRRGFLEAVALGYRKAGSAFRFDSQGNLRKA